LDHKSEIEEDERHYEGKDIASVRSDVNGMQRKVLSLNEDVDFKADSSCLTSVYSRKHEQVKVYYPKSITSINLNKAKSKNTELTMKTLGLHKEESLTARSNSKKLGVTET
jgi:hypothetical protein